MANTSKLSFWACLLLSYVLVRALFMMTPWRNDNTISYDAAGYYLPLPSVFIYNDLARSNFYDTLSVQRNIGDAVSHTVELPNGNRTFKYSLGMAVLYSPGFFVGNWIANNSDQYPADGYSKPYFMSLCLWAVLWSLLGLWVLRKLLLAYFSDAATAITLGLLVLGTNYLVYAGINVLMSHGFLFTLYVLLIYFSREWHLQPSLKYAVGIGLVMGLLCLARPTEIIAALIPLFWGIASPSDVAQQAKKLSRHFGHLAIVAAVMAAIGSIQLLYWKTYTGEWLFYSYQDQGFDFLRPKLWKGAFSFQKGWLIYTPVMLFAVLGFRWLYRQHRALFWPFLLFSLLNYYIVFSWKIWMYGGSVGARAMVQSYAVWCFPLAAFVQFAVEEASRIWKIGLAMLALLCVDLNLMMTWSAHASKGLWHAEYMSRAYYTRIVGRTNAPRDIRKFLDVSTELPRSKAHHTDTLVWETFDQPADSLLAGRSNEQVFSGAFAMKINGTNTIFSKTVPIPKNDDPRKYWLRASVRSFYTDMEWNEWRMARLLLIFTSNGQEVFQQSIRLQWLSDPWVWQDAHFEVPYSKLIARNLQPDAVRIELFNSEGEKNIYLDDLCLEWIAPK